MIIVYLLHVNNISLNNLNSNNIENLRNSNLELSKVINEFVNNINDPAFIFENTLKSLLFKIYNRSDYY